MTPATSDVSCRQSHMVHGAARGELSGHPLQRRPTGKASTRNKHCPHLPRAHVLDELVGVEDVVADLLAPLCKGQGGNTEEGRRADGEGWREASSRQGAGQGLQMLVLLAAGQAGSLMIASGAGHAQRQRSRQDNNTSTKTAPCHTRLP